jgi:hypothetical protein
MRGAVVIIVDDIQAMSGTVCKDGDLIGRSGDACTVVHQHAALSYAICGHKKQQGGVD